jgi:tryptophanyl-tRNA synthetase
VEGVLRDGARRALAMARPTVDAAYRAIGLLPASSDTEGPDTPGAGAVLDTAR